MKTQIGTAITGDFEDNTITFEIEGDMTLCAGKYAIVPIEEHEILVNNFALDNVSQQRELLESFVDYAKSRSIRDINIDDDTILYFLEDSNCG